MLGFISSWFKKSTPSELKITHSYSRGKAHPEKKTVSIQATNEDANILRYTNDIVSSYSKAVKRGVVGTGFSLQFKTKDIELNSEVESWLEYCGELGNADITKRFMGFEVERMITDELAIKGGVIIRHHWDKRLNTLYAPEILSMDTINRTKNDFANGLFSGIQTNKMGQISGLWIYKNQERRESTFVAIKNLTIKVIPYDPHQYGNISPLATIMLRLDELSDYTTAELDNAKKRAEKSLIMASPAADKQILAMEEYMESKDFKLQNHATQDSYRNEYSKLLKEFTTPGFHDQAVVTMDGTKVFDLQQGGGSEYSDLSINSKQTIAGGLGYSPGTIMKIPEHSYNSALKSAQEEEEENAILGKIVIAICKAIYRKQIEAGVILGEYNISDYYTKRRYYDRRLKVTRKIKGHIDPLKQVSADAAEVEVGLESKIQKLADKNRSYEDVIQDEIDYEVKKKEMYEQNGLTYIQTGTEKIAVEKAKAEEQDNDNN